MAARPLSRGVQPFCVRPMKGRISDYATRASDYVPEALKDAVGLTRRISADVRHLTWTSVDQVCWCDGVPRSLLLVGYVDGFQVWEMNGTEASQEILSRQGGAVACARLLPLPLPPRDGGGPHILGISAAPLLAYVERGTPNLVRIFSLKDHDDVHLLRLIQPARMMQASRMALAIGLDHQVELYDALGFQALFTVQCHGSSGPSFALGQRWIAYNLPPQQATNGHGACLLPHSSQLPAMVRGGMVYLGQVGQRTLDNVLMPTPEGARLPASRAAHSGVVAVRDVVSRGILGQFEDHAEATEAMAWDPSGLQLVSCAAMGHQILVHRAMTGEYMAAGGPGGGTPGSIVIQHTHTLCRGYTPAVISHLSVSDDGRLVAVSTAKGTVHVFQLPLAPPPLEAEGDGGGSWLCPSAAVPAKLGAIARVKLGSAVLREGLQPCCSFTPPPRKSGPLEKQTLSIATRAGLLSRYDLEDLKKDFAKPSSWACRLSPGSGGELGCEVSPIAEVRICRAPICFAERRCTPVDMEPPCRSSEEDTPGARAAVEAEEVVHVHPHVPLWSCPIFSFYVHAGVDSSSGRPLPSAELNAALRSGLVPARRRLHEVPPARKTVASDHPGPPEEPPESPRARAECADPPEEWPW